VADALGSALNEECAAAAPTVYLTTSEPEAPVWPDVPPEPFPVVLVAHCVDDAPQLFAVVAMFEKVPAPPKAAFQYDEAAPPPVPDADPGFAEV
jgi:hypothetical protein